jgi:pyruvate-ferredoxin/flavodoxin oxidoreductase
MSDQKVAVESGQWLLYRYNPERRKTGDNPLVLDSRTPTRKVGEFLLQQTRFKMLSKTKPEDAKRLWKEAQHDADARFHFYEYFSQRKQEPNQNATESPQAKSQSVESAVPL